jgi:hypothetical protein
MQKDIADSFDPSHAIEKELDLQGQNDRLELYTSRNLGTGDERVYNNVCDFIRSRPSSSPSTQSGIAQQCIHCIWYCVASDEQRAVHPLEARFFAELNSIAPHVPVVLVFTKYDDFVSQVQLDWSRNAQGRGLSKVAVSHILRDLTVKRFERLIGRQWDDITQGRSKVLTQRVCVASDLEDGDASFERLAVSTLGSLKDESIQLSFAVAQRNSASISTECEFGPFPGYGPPLLLAAS